MDLDPDKVTNDEREAFKQAEILKEFLEVYQLTSHKHKAVNVVDPSGAGGGNIGTGQAPVPGEQGFTAPQNPGQAAPQEPAVVDQLQQLLGVDNDKRSS